jgi:hypothetical protein
MPLVFCHFASARTGRYPDMSLLATPLDFVFKGYSIWLELEQVESDLDKAVDAAAVDLDVHAIPGMKLYVVRSHVMRRCSRSHIISCPFSSSRHGHLRCLSPLRGRMSQALPRGPSHSCAGLAGSPSEGIKGLVVCCCRYGVSLCFSFFSCSLRLFCGTLNRLTFPSMAWMDKKWYGLR